jgi:hypothetical protein
MSGTTKAAGVGVVAALCALAADGDRVLAKFGSFAHDLPAWHDVAPIRDFAGVKLSPLDVGTLDRTRRVLSELGPSFSDAEKGQSGLMPSKRCIAAGGAIGYYGGAESGITSTGACHVGQELVGRKPLNLFRSD